MNSYTDLIDAHEVVVAGEYQYDEDRAALIALIAEIDEFKQIAENADITDYAINEETVNAAVDYFTYWGGVFGDGEFAGGANELGKVINAIVAAVAMDDVDTEAKMNALLAAQAALEALGPNAQSYVKAKTENTLVEELADFDFSNMLWITEIAPQTYTGKAIKPEIKVYEGLKLLQEKVDYTLSYKNNTKAFEFDDALEETYVEPYNEVKAAYDAKDAAYKTAEDDYNAKKAAYDAAAQDVKDAQAAMKGLKRGTEEYNAAKAAYDAAVKAKSDASKAMSAAKSAMTKAKSEMTKAKSALTKAENKLASKAPAVIVNFKKNYTGQAYRYFEINRVDLSTANQADAKGNVTLSIADVCVADGSKVSAIKPVVTLNGKKVSTNEYLVKVYDLDVEGNSYNPETEAYTLDTEMDAKKGVITEDGNYAFQIVPKDTTKVKSNFCGEYVDFVKNAPILMSKATIAKIPAQDYAAWDALPDWNGEVTPDVVVTYKVGKQTLPLIEDVHYTVEYSKHTGAGTATVTIIGTGRTVADQPDVEVPDGFTKEDYEDRSFTGTKTATFKINGIKMASNMVTFSERTITKDYAGDGKKIELDAGVWNEDMSAVKDGEYALKYTKRGEASKPMTEGIDYKVEYKNNENKGTATIIFTGMGNYTGTVKKTFKIVAATLTGDMFEVTDSAEYTKSGAKPVITVKDGYDLTEGVDYTVTYKNNKKIYKLTIEDDRKAPTVTIKGKGNYAGTVVDTYSITAGNFGAKDVNDEYIFDGVAKDVLFKANKKGNFKTTFTLTDPDGKKLSTKDYTFEYYKAGDDEPLDVKTDIVAKDDAAKWIDMQIVVTGLGNYEGSKMFIDYHLYTQMITKAKIDRNSKAIFVYDRYEQEFVGVVEGELGDDGIKLTYTEKVNGETVTRTLTPGVDYEIGHIKNTLPGTATAEIIGLNEFGGTKKITFRIQKNSAAVSALDDRIHFFENYADTQTMFFGGDSENLMLYTATPIVLF